MAKSKVGHCKIQLRPLGVETGHHPAMLESRLRLLWQEDASSGLLCSPGSDPGSPIGRIGHPGTMLGHTALFRRICAACSFLRLERNALNACVCNENF